MAVLVLIFPILVRAEETVPSFNVRNYGATGKKADDA
jgi:hypothetical protein